MSEKEKLQKNLPAQGSTGHLKKRVGGQREGLRPSKKRPELGGGGQPKSWEGRTSARKKKKKKKKKSTPVEKEWSTMGV